MYLIADGGSTKVDWVLLENNKEKERFTTTGLNPSILSSLKIKERLLKISELESIHKKIKIIFFYGAGCSKKKSAEMETIFSLVFINAQIHIKEDTYAASYATLTKEPSIVSILGTGSNSSYFDGTTLINTIPSLGFSIMDEASGNYYGKKLLQDYFYNKMPKHIAHSFSNLYDLSPDEIKTNLYQKESPNMYLASFAKFMYSIKEEEYTINLIKKGFQLFVENKIKTIDNYKELPIHCVGSIAFYFKNILTEVLNENNLNVGQIIQKPIDNLVIYHQNLID